MVVNSTETQVKVAEHASYATISPISQGRQGRSTVLNRLITPPLQFTSAFLKQGKQMATMDQIALLPVEMTVDSQVVKSTLDTSWCVASFWLLSGST